MHGNWWEGSWQARVHNLSSALLWEGLAKVGDLTCGRVPRRGGDQQLGLSRCNDEACERALLRG